MKGNTEQLISRLKEVNYGMLFLSDDTLIDSLWQKAENEDALKTIVSDEHFNPYARLLASELLFEKSRSYPPAEWKDKLAELYSKALLFSGAESGGKVIPANQWGFLYHSEGREGILGKHLLYIGENAIPYLKELLENESLFFYEGSEEATIGNSYGYRVKDAAAYYIGKITGKDIKFCDEASDRDAEIEQLKKELK